jgi:hypothetical protein
MKKLIAVTAILSVMFLGIGTSQALVGMPDAVPGTHLIQPFFLVPIPGTSGTDNTLMTLTEVGGLNVRGQDLHWRIWNRNSVHMADGHEPYTAFDVVVLNAQELLKNVSELKLIELEVDLDKDATTGNIRGNEYYMGYITYENSNTTWPVPPFMPWVERGVDNFIGHMYVVDIPTGRASGAIIPAREWAPRSVLPFPGPPNPLHPESYWPMQNAYLDTSWVPPIGILPLPNFTDYEVFTAAALAYSRDREHSAAPFIFALPTWFRLLPRYYLKDGHGETFFFIWTSGNWGKFFDDGLFDPDTYEVEVDIYDEDENCLSGGVNLPYELNFINVRRTIPSNWLDVALGGWFDIRWDIGCVPTPDPGVDFPWAWDAIPLAAEWLGYSYQYAHSPDKSLNWNALYPMHRDVDELVPLPLVCP